MPAVRKLINVPQTTDPVNFAPRADSLLATQFNNTVDDINFVADAMTLNATNDTSTSSVLIGLGVKSFTVSLNKSFVPGMALLFADTAAGSANWMLILTDTYNPATGAFTGTCIKFAGSGTKAAWSISQSVRGGDLATVNLSGPINFAQGTIAFNATTMDILGQPNTVIVTGSGTLTALPDSAQAGIYRRIKWSGAVVLATTGNITSANGTITTAAGMYSDVYYDSASLKSITTYLADGSIVPSTQITATVASNILTGGWSGGALVFRSPTLTSGSIVSASSSPLSIAVPSGATLGTANTLAARLVLLVAYNAGTEVLCIANTSGGLVLDETNLISPTTISAASTSAGVIYSASAVSANSPYRVVGFLDIAEAVAGTWATAPTVLQSGSAATLGFLAASNVNVGQTVQNVTASRVIGTTYSNLSNKNKFVSVRMSSTIQFGQSATVTPSGGAAIGYAGTTQSAVNQGVTITFIVPPNATYNVTGSGGTLTLLEWIEV